jgi:hypothetical protein
MTLLSHDSTVLGKLITCLYDKFTMIRADLIVVVVVVVVVVVIVPFTHFTHFTR